MITDTYNHADRVGFVERLGRLAGSTTWREPGTGGGSPYVSRRIPSEHAMALALSMARRNDRDVGPDVAYSVGTGLPHQQQRVINWLGGKLLDGTGRVGQRNQSRVLHAASQAYELVIGTRRHITPPPGKEAHRDFELLVNIGAGWLWIAMEFAVERAERALCPA